MLAGDVAAAMPLPGLNPRERRILSHVLHGESSKCIALEVGLSETQVSKTLAASAIKLGFHNRAELVRYAASQAGMSQTALPELTRAERVVLELIVVGHSNEQIAVLRGRSRKTVENQVSALLRKTGLSSRRGLMVAFCNVAHQTTACVT